MGVSASFFTRQDERCSSAFASPGLCFCSSPGRFPLWHWQCFQQLLWRGQPRLKATTTTGSTTKASAAAKIPAATVPATASAAVPASAPAAVPAATAAVPAPASKATVPAAATASCPRIQPKTHSSSSSSSQACRRDKSVRSSSSKPLLDGSKGQHSERVRGYLEGWLLHIPAARGQGLLRVDGHGAGLPRQPRQAGQLQQIDCSRCAALLLDGRSCGPRQRGGVVEQPECKADPIQRERPLVPHRRG